MKYNEGLASTGYGHVSNLKEVDLIVLGVKFRGTILTCHSISFYFIFFYKQIKIPITFHSCLAISLHTSIFLIHIYLSQSVSFLTVYRRFPPRYRGNRLSLWPLYRRYCPSVLIVAIHILALPRLLYPDRSGFSVL